MSQMDVLEQVLQELLKEANTALVALRKIARACPNVIREIGSGQFYYIKWKKDYRGKWVNVSDLFASFKIGSDGYGGEVIEGYEWGLSINNPGGFLAAMLRKEKEKLASVVKLADVLPDEEI